MSIKCIHFGAYYHGKNDIVYAMANDLADYIPTICVDMHLYDKTRSQYVREDFAYHQSSIFSIKYTSPQIVKELIKKYDPEIVITNAGGLTFEDETFNTLKARGIKTIGISLSDPDVFPYQSIVYAHKYDTYLTNSRYSLENQYAEAGKKVFLLPFAASPCIHYPIPRIKKIHDIVIVGEYRKDREATVKALQKNFNVGLYGPGWGTRKVEGQAHCEAINSGKIYLSFSKTAAGYTNVKIGLLEAAACKVTLITQRFDEIHFFFKEDEEIVLYDSIPELIREVRGLLQNPERVKSLSENSYERFVSEHTWRQRWEDIIKRVQE